MRLQGEFKVGNATLCLDVEIPTDGGVVCVTNTPAECLIIPRERLPLAALGLSSEVLNELADRRVTTVADVIGLRGWNVRLRELSDTAAQELTEMMSILCDCALMPDDPQDHQTEVLPSIPFPIDAEEELEEIKAQVTQPTSSSSPDVKVLQDTDPLITLKIPDRAIRALHARSCSTIAALCNLTKSQLVMTPGVTQEDVTHIENTLAHCGRHLRSRKGN